VNPKHHIDKFIDYHPEEPTNERDNDSFDDFPEFLRIGFRRSKFSF